MLELHYTNCTNGAVSQDSVNNLPQETLILRKTPVTSLLKQSVLATIAITQEIFTCSNFRIETLQKGMIYVQN